MPDRQRGDTEGEDRHVDARRARHAGHGEIRDLLGAEDRRHERLDRHRRLRVEVVAEGVELVNEARQREEREVEGHHREIDQRAHVAHRRHPQGQDEEHTERERNPVEVRERGAVERRHADVVVEGVDLLDVVAGVAALDLVGVDVERQPLRF